MPNRPPPYFPQEQLSPPDPKRYRAFKIAVAIFAFLLILLIIGAGVAIYYLLTWLFA
ncbi:MAG: hypothetical protein N2Z23_01450 [Pyrinomonadaceae bacterium]|nr:hypothetical protein [Pyrinomonadaceae bacterium]MCX7639095.1 hypothetical protein [Pyrinomonadaceae bacterium]MDW8303684.1 hypothetical protein [Acidobacteriota bacterium]